ncbi:MAG: tail fiber domain-containing protein [Bacteroidetes bacterium]|nr:tail fiber domain-containing protein [Bacteroidota bacterium]
MRKLLFLSIILLSVTFVRTQNVGIGTTSPNANAILHMVSTNKGVMIPQVSLDSLRDVTSIPLPSTGLLVYNTTEPGVRNDMARGFYYYNTTALTWVRLSDNLNDKVWKKGGLLGIQLEDTTDGVEILDNYTGSVLNFSPKVKILRLRDSALLNSKNNINTLVLTGVNRKIATGWEFRQKNTITFENGYTSTGAASSANAQVAAISAYTENPGPTQPSDNRFNGLAFYTFAVPTSTATLDTPTVSMFYHNVGIGAYATDIKNVTEGRLQITGFSNGDQLSLRHPSSINLKWGMYVSSIDSSLNFYSNGSLRANIDRVTGVYTALSDRNKKKNIRPMLPVLEMIRQLPVYSYHYTDSKDDDRRMIGLMAQDVQSYFPELVYQRYDRDISKPVLTMDYSGFGVLAIKAIQEQQVMINDLKSQLAASKSTELADQVKKQQLLIEQLLQRIEKLEKK